MAKLIEIHKSLMEENNRTAAALRRRFAKDGIRVINLMGSPGCGKTSLIENLAQHWQGKFRIAVIEGDVASSIDSQRLEAAGVVSVQINTMGACHLDAVMVEAAVRELQAEKPQILLVENIGNLICPSGYDLGEGVRIVLTSWAEGSDKPLKYPSLFARADGVIVNKCDLEGYCDFDKRFFLESLETIGSQGKVFWVSCRTGAGTQAVADWLASCNTRFL